MLTIVSGTCVVFDFGQVIGKDITRFHCIYWPIMLMSAEVPLPKGVYAHGFVMDKNGTKFTANL